MKNSLYNEPLETLNFSFSYVPAFLHSMLNQKHLFNHFYPFGQQKIMR